MKRNTMQTESQAAHEALASSDADDVPVALLALEVGRDVDDLARLLAGEMTVDPATSLRCVSAEVCRREVDAHRDRERRRVEMMREAEAKLLAARPAPVRYRPDERLQELAARGAMGGQQ